ncbi:hypothetical protein PF005_g30188 [Phytophthora fragariae]|uniref:Uncharacterized protein n=1 Tax=Phytophthora fragariae TaxID=53985 RepID=A0A6A3DIQ1_9STRA|nr:hypothetical protein PF003_g30141 [Phytophthora fragariae]KAE8919577.1 hypothetical protein PF009_g30119 [Phytophthora fragariae]KAE8962461.1 hypothetical protein PF011_g29386 [Phytophthora fragariae]KAE9061166.1 hypothetical protein PF010_g29920 [Phytophthora fragariae]KAE9063427.1 hypothetical protein PF007_g29562 [Phytophthora fragariae]
MTWLWLFFCAYNATCGRLVCDLTCAAGVWTRATSIQQVLQRRDTADKNTFSRPCLTF